MLYDYNAPGLICKISLHGVGPTCQGVGKEITRKKSDEVDQTRDLSVFSGQANHHIQSKHLFEEQMYLYLTLSNT